MNNRNPSAPATSRTRPSISLALMLALITAISGCGDMEWNWDLAWWKKPRRVVRPTRPNDATDQQRARRPQQPPKENENDAVAIAPTQPPAESPTQPAAPPPAPIPDRPFYYLYFISDEAAAEESSRGETRVLLQNAPALVCSRLMEMLYVPLGRSGSTRESYVIYEDQPEFRAAAAMAGSLDLTPAQLPTNSIGAEGAFESGVGMLLGAVEAGPGHDARLVEACERKFVEALQSTDLPPMLRWAAGIFAGRVASQFKYDHAEARSYYKQAERLVPEDSIERMTARWWRADALTQEGKPADAMLVYQDILATFGEAHPNAHIIRRSKALIEEYNKQ